MDVGCQASFMCSAPLSHSAVTRRELRLSNNAFRYIPECVYPLTYVTKDEDVAGPGMTELRILAVSSLRREERVSAVWAYVYVGACVCMRQSRQS